MLLIIKFLAKIFTILNGEISPRQIAAGFALEFDEALAIEGVDEAAPGRADRKRSTTPAAGFVRTALAACETGLGLAERTGAPTPR